MKSKLITFLVVAGVITGIVAINKFEPRRVAEQQHEEIIKAKAGLEAADAIAEAEIAAAEKEAAAIEAATDAAVQAKMKEESENGTALAAEIPEAPAPVVVPALTVAPAGGPYDYTAVFDTSKGRIVIEVKSELAPLGVKQFRKAIEAGVYNEARFFRVIPGFMVQFGIPGDPKLAAEWKFKRIMDDPVKISNTPGTITFATSGKNSRTSQVFINYIDNSRLDKDGFTPFGKVIQGMDVAKSFFSEYGAAPSNQQGRIQSGGNAFLNQSYPKLDYIKKVTIVKPGEAIPPAPKVKVEAEAVETQPALTPSEAIPAVAPTE